jgi:prolyl 4-hydroxylase
VIPQLKTPPYLLEQQREMQATAPNWELGFTKGQLADDVFQRLLNHLTDNVSRCRAEHNITEIRNDNPAAIPALILSDEAFNRQLATDLQPMHEQWSGLDLQYSSCYGIRIYQRGTYLYQHVDRPTHVVSSAICVASELDQPWPLQVEKEDGTVSQVNLCPGEFLFYEGARLAHGRPYPLRGDYYAAIFLHYHPIVTSTQGPERK